jgi:hypothetical protein
MDHDQSNEFGIDPLGELEVQRALALARARESYPAVPREKLLGCCEAAWAVALEADPRGHDLQRSFDRALLIIAWTQRRSGGRVPLRDLVEQTVPRIALEPFISEREPAAVADEELPAEAAIEKPGTTRRPLLRVPFTSPLPIGAALAAGFVGLAVLNETEVLPIAPLQPTGSEGESSGEDTGARADGSGGAAGSESAGERGASGALGAGLLADGLSDAAQQVQAGAVPSERGAGAESSGRPADEPAPGSEREGAATEIAAESLTSATSSSPPADAPAVASAPVAPVDPPAPVAPPQPVVRIEMPPPTMVVEVTAPPRRQVDPAEPDAAPAPPGDGDVAGPGEPVVDGPNAPEEESGNDGDGRPAAVDVLEDALPVEGHDDEMDEGEPFTPSPPPKPVTAPAAPAPVAPAPPASPPAAEAPAPPPPAEVPETSAPAAQPDPA